MWIGHRTEFLKQTFRALALPRILPSLFLLRGGAGGFEEVNLDRSEVTSYSFMRAHGRDGYCFSGSHFKPKHKLRGREFSLVSHSKHINMYSSSDISLLNVVRTCDLPS